MVRRLNVNEKYFNMTETYRFIRNVWGEGSGSLCFSIPAEIVKKMKIDSDSFLYVELINDSIFGVRKINHKLSKDEIKKIEKLDHTEIPKEKQTKTKDIKIENSEEEKDSYNPLDDVF